MPSTRASLPSKARVRRSIADVAGAVGRPLTGGRGVQLAKPKYIEYVALHPELDLVPIEDVLAVYGSWWAACHGTRDVVPRGRPPRVAASLNEVLATIRACRDWKEARTGEPVRRVSRHDLAEYCALHPEAPRPEYARCIRQWTELCHLAGVEPGNAAPLNDDGTLAEALRDVSEASSELGHPVGRREFVRVRPGMHHSEVLAKHLGGWDKVLAAAGVR